VHLLLELFLTFVKIGLFTFGGGYAMISMIEGICVEKKGWITHEEMMDITVIAESTPGPIAINCSTYLGYKKEKILGSVVATVGVCIPSFSIIFLISLFFNQFLSITWVAAAFKGIQVCVIFLILSAGWKMLKKMKKTAFNIIVACATFICMLCFSLFSVTFSSIFYILISGSLGLLLYTIGYIKTKNGKESGQ
jgi:chromate transporter